MLFQSHKNRLRIRKMIELRHESKSYDSANSSRIDGNVSSSPLGCRSATSTIETTDAMLSRIRDLENEVERTRKLTEKITLEIENKQNELTEARSALENAQIEIDFLRKASFDDLSYDESLSLKNPPDPDESGGEDVVVNEILDSIRTKKDFLTPTRMIVDDRPKGRSYKDLYNSILSHSPQKIKQRKAKSKQPKYLKSMKMAKPKKKQSSIWKTKARVSEKHKSQLEEIFNMTVELNGLEKAMFMMGRKISIGGGHLGESAEHPVKKKDGFVLECESVGDTLGKLSDSQEEKSRMSSNFSSKRSSDKSALTSKSFGSSYESGCGPGKLSSYHTENDNALGSGSSMGDTLGEYTDSQEPVREKTSEYSKRSSDKSGYLHQSRSFESLSSKRGRGKRKRCPSSQFELIDFADLIPKRKLTEESHEASDSFGEFSVHSSAPSRSSFRNTQAIVELSITPDSKPNPPAKPPETLLDKNSTQSIIRFPLI